MSTIQDYFRKRKLSDGSYRAYMQRLKSLNGGKEPTDVSFLEDFDSVFKYISKLSNNTQRSYLITVTQALKSVSGMDDVKDIYELKLEELENVRIENEDNYRKSDKEKERMCSMDELNAVTDYWLETIDDVIYNKSRVAVIVVTYKNAWVSLLYTQQAPIRLEYGSMIVIENEEDIKPRINYLIRGEDSYKFVLQDYKTKKSQGVKKWTVKSTQIKKILDEWFKLNTSGYLFPNRQWNAPMTMNSFGKMIPKVFESIGKKITLNIIRHVWISHHVDYKVLDTHAALASAMGHSLSTQKAYVKV